MVRSFRRQKTWKGGKKLRILSFLFARLPIWCVILSTEFFIKFSHVTREAKEKKPGFFISSRRLDGEEKFAIILENEQNLIFLSSIIPHVFLKFAWSQSEMKGILAFVDRFFFSFFSEGIIAFWRSSQLHLKLENLSNLLQFWWSKYS